MTDFVMSGAGDVRLFAWILGEVEPFEPLLTRDGEWLLVSRTALYGDVEPERLEPELRRLEEKKKKKIMKPWWHQGRISRNLDESSKICD